MRNDHSRNKAGSEKSMPGFHSSKILLRFLPSVITGGMPMITIPWSGAMDNHQYKNACEFVKLSGNAGMFSEDGSPEELSRLIMSMLK